MMPDTNQPKDETPDETWYLKERMPVDGSDGPWGELEDLVIEPAHWQVTHLVIQPHRHHERSHLVPIEAATNVANRLSLSWSSSQIEAAPTVSESDFISLGTGTSMSAGWEPGEAPMLAWPRWETTGRGSLLGYGYTPGTGNGYAAAEPALARSSFDRTPEGTVEVRRASRVMSSDHHLVGHVDGFVVDPQGSIVCLVLRHGHLWGECDINIPRAAIDSAHEDTVVLRVPREQIGRYPNAPLHRFRSKS